ncbi:unnamed protein product [Cuscuta campestris]|uniref:Uncharacterized protein n=1 Tax=Cuscuta campestris TaxID=132261 RepID=A0A484KH23_9ASTE|nr:unnamed protein product [Cuscuta campestris]
MEFYKKTQDEGSKQLKEEGEEALGLGVGIIKFEDDVELSWAETSADLDETDIAMTRVTGIANYTIAFASFRQI